MTEWLETNGPPILLALMGGVADFLNSEDHSISSLLVGAFLACFVGYMGLLVCTEYGVSPGMTSMICGFLGYTSRTLLIVIKRVSKKKLLQGMFGSVGATLPKSVGDALDEAEAKVSSPEEQKRSNTDADSKS